MSISASEVAAQVAQLAAIPMFAGYSDSDLAMIAVLSLSAGVVLEGGSVTVDTSLLTKEATLQDIRDRLPSGGVFPVTATSLPLATGAATEATLAQAEADLDVIIARLGANGDAASAIGSQSAQLRQIAALLAGTLPIAGTVNLGTIGTAATEASLAAAKTNLDTIITRQGTNGDPASATGSQAAQLRAIANLLAAPLAVAQSGVWTVGSSPHIVNSTTPTSVSVTSAGVTVLAANSSRTMATIANDGTTQCYLYLGSAGTAGTGIPLTGKGSSYSINATNLYRGAITAITASGVTATLSVSEGV